MILMQLQKNVNYLPSALKGLYSSLLTNIFNILGSQKFMSIFNVKFKENNKEKIYATNCKKKTLDNHISMVTHVICIFG